MKRNVKKEKSKFSRLMIFTFTFSAIGLGLFMIAFIFIYNSNLDNRFEINNTHNQNSTNVDFTQDYNYIDEFNRVSFMIEEIKHDGYSYKLETYEGLSLEYTDDIVIYKYRFNTDKELQTLSIDELYDSSLFCDIELFVDYDEYMSKGISKIYIKILW